MTRAIIQTSNWLARVLFAVAYRLEDWGRHLDRCPDCGRSRFYGAPCVR